MRYIQDKMCTEKNNMLAVLKGDNYLFVLKYRERDGGLTETVEYLDSLTQQLCLCCGVSDTFDSLARIKVHKDQAFAAMADGISAGQPVGVYTFIQRYSSILAAASMEKMGLKACLKPECKRLMLEDNAMGRQNIQTLGKYYSCLCNSAQTAEEMGLHKNTIANRLETIEEETKWKLDNPDDALDIQLQLNIIATNALVEGCKEGDACD
jgi:DNA-binding PucR family transcriptional regulator